MDELGLRQELSQQLRLNPQMLQNMALLQMNIQDLGEYMSQAAQENPLLEIEEPDMSAYREFVQQYQWAGMDEPVAEPGVNDPGYDSRGMSLREQLSRLGLDHVREQIGLYLIEQLDEDGFLEEEDWERVRNIDGLDAAAEDALAAVQSLDPAGIAARSRTECLLLQLRRKGEETPLLIELINHHLEEIARHHYDALSVMLGVSHSQIETAARKITGLDPHPGRQEVAAQEQTQYIQPDAYIVESDGTLSVVLNDYYLPRLHINETYEQMLHEVTDAETMAYLRERLRSARELLHGVSMRGVTLRRCLEQIVAEQEAFFLLPDGVMRPMTQRELSERLGIHPSTVSRTLRGKYLQCRRGLYAMNDFFCRSVGISAPQEIRSRMQEMLQENALMNDREIHERLTEEGYILTRRTVTNYRKVMGLPTVAVRRRRKTGVRK